MTANADLVRVAVTGAVRTAALGVSPPTDSTTTHGAGWVDLGYVSSDGVTETPNADWNEIKAWQNGAIVRRSLTSSDVQWKFVLIETKQETLEAYHIGSEMRVLGGKAVLPVVAPTWDPKQWSIDVIDGSVHNRIVIPKATVTDRGDIVYNGEDAIGYEITITALDSGTTDPNGRAIYANKYSDDPSWAAFASA